MKVPVLVCRTNIKDTVDRSETADRSETDDVNYCMYSRIIYFLAKESGNSFVAFFTYAVLGVLPRVS
jgi:hypothetical protein